MNDTTRQNQTRATIWTLPNIITLARIGTIPVVIALMLGGDELLRIIAAVLYVIAAATDWVDGWIARRYGMVSPFGRMLDPIADKLLVGVIIVALAWDGAFTALDLIPACAILMREIFVSGLREYLGSETVVLPVTQLAKWKTTIQLFALALVMVVPLLPALALVGSVALWVAGVITVVTGAQYLVASWPHFRGTGR